MKTVYQTHDFLSGRRLSRSKYLGSFFSTESAEKKLGWFFIVTCCQVADF